MLIACIIAYILLTLLVGFYASRKVKTTQDFALAGRKLPLIICSSAFFATWFGAETVLGASSQFLEHGIGGILEDPVGASLCLLLVGLVFAVPLYRMNILSLGDFYRNRFGSRVELAASLFMVISYFGWIAAQFIAFGVVLNSISGIPVPAGIATGMLVVVIYTCWGGMWAVSVTDFIQTVVIIAGMLVMAYRLSGEAGGVSHVLSEAPPGYFTLFKERSLKELLEHVAALITLGLGSLPSQDIFQRIMSARSEKVAVRSALLGSLMYITIALIPLFIALCVKVAYPQAAGDYGQSFIPYVVMVRSDLLVQIFFFGALLSAIMSTASAAILAPATVLAENILKPALGELSDRRFLLLLRASVIGIALLSLLVIFYNDNIYELAGESSAVTLVSLFIPLVAGLYVRKANSTGALLGMFSGLVSWGLLKFGFPVFQPVIGGLLGSLAGMIGGNLLHRFLKPENTPLY
jgi:solute:Na+ symporter, SSS family